MVPDTASETVFLAAPLVGTASMLLAVPPEGMNAVQGVLEAVDGLARRIGAVRARYGYEAAVRGFEAVVTGRIDDPRSMIELLTAEIAARVTAAR